MEQDQKKARMQQDQEPGTQQHSQKPAEGDEQDIEQDIAQKEGKKGKERQRTDGSETF